VIDNFISPREHFDLFPAVFRVLSNQAVLVVLVVPEASPRLLKRYPHMSNEEHLARRSAFYGVDGAQRIALDRVAAHYGSLARSNGLAAEWSFLRTST
jgi:hypothetical protein